MRVRLLLFDENPQSKDCTFGLGVGIESCIVNFFGITLKLEQDN